MSNAIQRSFRILEHLSSYPGGRTLTELAAEMDAPVSATHRLLGELVDCGYVNKDARHGDFTLSMQVVSLGLRYLSASGISDIAQPALDRLAAHSGELVRLAIVDREQLIYVAKAQGASQGLRYDPEMGQPVTLSCSAAGFAWLATMDDEEATRLVAKQGFGSPKDYGPRAPTNFRSLMGFVHVARKRGMSTTADVFQPAMSSMAAAIRRVDGQVAAMLIIAGPSARLTEERMKSLAGPLLETAADLSRLSASSPMFKVRPVISDLSSSM